MKKFTATNSGNEVVINLATMKDVQRLKQVILSEVQKSPIGIKLIQGDKSIFEREIDFTGIIDFLKNTLIGIDTSEDFMEAIYACLQYCTYKKVYKINEELFDNEAVPEARSDYYEIIFTCIEENLRPFIQGLISTWKIHISQNNLLQKFATM